MSQGDLLMRQKLHGQVGADAGNTEPSLQTRQASADMLEEFPLHREDQETVDPEGDRQQMLSDVDDHLRTTKLLTLFKRYAGERLPVDLDLPFVVTDRVMRFPRLVKFLDVAGIFVGVHPDDIEAFKAKIKPPPQRFFVAWNDLVIIMSMAAELRYGDGCGGAEHVGSLVESAVHVLSDPVSRALLACASPCGIDISEMQGNDPPSNKRGEGAVVGIGERRRWVGDLGTEASPNAGARGRRKKGSNDREPATASSITAKLFYRDSKVNHAGNASLRERARHDTTTNGVAASDPVSNASYIPAQLPSVFYTFVYYYKTVLRRSSEGPGRASSHRSAAEAYVKRVGLVDDAVPFFVMILKPLEDNGGTELRSRLLNYGQFWIDAIVPAARLQFSMSTGIAASELLLQMILDRDAQLLEECEE